MRPLLLALLLAACGSTVTIEGGSSGAGATGGYGSGAGGIATSGTGGTPSGAGGEPRGTGGEPSGAGGLSNPGPCPPTYGIGLVDDGWGVGQYCDDLTLCTPSPVAAAFSDAFPDADCSPDPDCGQGESACAVAGGEVSAARYDQLCTASQQGLVTSAVCAVYGP